MEESKEKIAESRRRNDQTTSSFPTKRHVFAILGVAIPVSLMLWQSHHYVQPFLHPYKRADVVYGGGSASLSVNSGGRNGTYVHHQAKANLPRRRYNNISTSKVSTTNSSLVSAPKLVLPAEEIEWIVKKRDSLFKQWLNSSHMDLETKAQHGYRKRSQRLQHGADENSGPWLDFLVIGFAKCGTSTLMANLGQVAPMPVQDICTPPIDTLRLAHQEWPNHFITDENRDVLVMRGSKCPRYIGTDVGFLKRYSQSLTKTKFIVGIRHPILWFQSFWRMIGGQSPYLRMELCPCPPDNNGSRVCKIKREQPLIFDGWNRTQIEEEAVTYETPKGKACTSECTDGMLFCMMRGRFHVGLAQLGKTMLGQAERQWLAPNDVDGGSALLSFNITNRIFLYEQTTLGEDSVWQELADFLGLSHIPNISFQDSKGQGFDNDICLPEYDYFRSVMMVYSYQLSVWLMEYFLPIARDPSRHDVIVGNIDRLQQIVATSYRQDPCKRLILAKLPVGEKQNSTNIRYILNPSLGETLWVPSQEYIANLTAIRLKEKEEQEKKAAARMERQRNRMERKAAQKGGNGTDVSIA